MAIAHVVDVGEFDGYLASSVTRHQHLHRGRVWHRHQRLANGGAARAGDRIWPAQPGGQVGFDLGPFLIIQHPIIEQDLENIPFKEPTNGPRRSVESGPHKNPVGIEDGHCAISRTRGLAVHEEFDATRAHAGSDGHPPDDSKAGRRCQQILRAIESFTLNIKRLKPPGNPRAHIHSHAA